MGNIEAEDAAVITTTAGCAPWHRAAERAAHDERRGSGNACHRYDTRRGSGGKAWRASRQGVLHVITTTVGRILRHRAAGQAAAHGKIIDAVGTAYHTYDSVSCIVPSCRREGGIARRTSRQRVPPIITTTVGRTSLHRAAGRAAAHHQHRGSGKGIQPRARHWLGYENNWWSPTEYVEQQRLWSSSGCGSRSVWTLWCEFVSM